LLFRDLRGDPSWLATYLGGCKLSFSDELVAWLVNEAQGDE